MPSTQRPFRPLLASCMRVMALVLVTALVALWQYGRLDPGLWDVPADYSGDAMEILARLKAASEGGLRPLVRPVISRLGAPFGADWSDYPPSDTILFSLLGLLASVVGVGAASNMALVLAHCLSALSFYFCARWLRHRWEWALMGALLFSFTFHSVYRGLAHLSLIFTWTVPLALLCCGIIARGKRLERGSPSWWLCIATTAALAVSNPYNLFLFLQLLGWVLVASWIGNRRNDSFRAGVLCMALAVGLLALMMMPQWIHRGHEDAQPVLVRNYGGTEKYALKPVELWIPPDVHRSDALASLGSRYLRWSDWRGETFSPYLGWVGGAGLIALLGLAVIRITQRRGIMPRAVLPAGWVLAFSAVGGINSVLAFFIGLQVFRATNRYSVFLSAIALMFVVGCLSRRSVRWPRRISIVCALFVACVGLWDQLPRRDREREAEAIARYRSDQLYGRLLEDAFPAGSRIFQLPFVEFPEAGPILAFGAYDHFRVYLASHSLQFTFGALKGRAASAWQEDYAQLPSDQLVRKLGETGFAGVLLNRDAYGEKDFEALVSELEKLSGGKRLEGPQREHVMVGLNPPVNPAPPFARGVTFGRGWNPPEPGYAGVRWAYGDASFAYFNPLHETMIAELRFALSGVNTGTARLLHEGRVLTEQPVDTGVGERLAIQLRLHPGVNQFELQFDAPAVRTSEDPHKLRSVAVHQMVLSLQSDILP